MTTTPAGQRSAEPMPLHVLAASAADGAAGHGRQSLDLLMGNVASILSSEVTLCCRQDARGKAPAVISSWGLGPTGEPARQPGKGGFVGRALRAERAVLGPIDPRDDSVLMSGAVGSRVTHGVAAPVRLPRDIAGTLVAGFSAPPVDHRMTLWAAEACAAMLSLCLYEADLLAPLLQPASVDPLTGCLGYAGTRHELEREINRSTRWGLSLSVCFIDLDDFKRVNDQFGHLHGNEVLARVGRALRDGVRSCDSVGRFGGDEFVAIFPETNESDAVHLATRMRNGIAETPVPAPDRRLTASVGVAERTAGESADQLIERADQLMQLTKAHKGVRIRRTYLPREPPQRQG